MRRLLLLRHAKAASPAGSRDIDRPLAHRGREAAPLMGAYLKDEQLLPDLALVSSAVRTRQTWDLVQPAFGKVEARFEPRIYEAPAERLLAVLREVEPAVHTLLMVGHNPGFADLARALVGHGDRYAFARMVQKYPTAGLAIIDFDVENWTGVRPAAGRLERFVTPKSLGADADD
jgi:phosphohistidine phosphatase